MKFALVNKQRQEAQPDLRGECPGCGRPVVSRCGEIRAHHWAHQGRRLCDPWWENETEWHRTWKDRFPTDWQEIVHTAEGGERHIADVKTDQQWVIEFQHSHITPEERLSRNTFYRQLIWVVDGLRRKRDWAQFQNAWVDGRQIDPHSRVIRGFWDECALLREWADSRAPVFFDFGKCDDEALWWLLAKRPEGLYVGRILRSDFVGFHVGDAEQVTRGFERWLRQRVESYMSHFGPAASNAAIMQRLQPVQQTFVPRHRLRRRL